MKEMPQVRFSLIIKAGPTVLASVEGRDLPANAVRMSDMHELQQVEKTLERMFGLRFHIGQI